ncbi:FAD-binding domain-containing protein [Acaromyces ingoldii]|uniref:FAD-binding domain-containing protein n=1 Tax=Acaromyces ingoldii TaxID=215250 RepID=A0A316YCB1_9BASI|nr:FAD-binding domain-containing protein [Acaromyces ingoldii]PWN86912.1 FAD-binding domain-containing protein [Acaromyces ingoldii]
MYVPVVLLLASSALVSGAAIDNVSPQAWTALSSAVQGRLYTETPLAKPCYALYNGTLNTPDAAQCAQVIQGYKTDTYLVTQPGGYLNTNWGTCQANAQGCNLDYTAPAIPASGANCFQGSVPSRYIDVRRYQDVQAALAFSTATGVPLVVKNSGHDYKGRSSAPNSLKLWTHNLQPAITLKKAFVAAGCAASTATTAVSFGAGQGFLGLYQFAEDNNITIVGGSSPTVGTAGGWITGAGHSSISNTLGLGVDNVLEMQVVTGKGQYLTASRCQNADLFYAMRGGGGGTFGVIMSMTTRAQPRLNLQVAYIRFVSANLDSVRGFLKVLIENARSIAQDGWGGYIEPAAMSTQASGLVLFTPKLNNAAAKASMKNVTDYVAALTSANVILNNEVDEGGTFFSAYNKYLVPNEELVGLGTAIGSRLIPTANFVGAANQQTLLDALMNVVNTVEQPFPLAEPLLYTYGAPLQFLVTTPYNYKDDGTSAVTPAWRNSLWHVFINSAFSNEASATEISAAFQRSHTAADFLRKITPTSGAYLNEADAFEPDPINSFWGQTNYKKLLSLKSKFDPKNLLTNHQAIGWNASDPRYACYPPAPSSTL